MELPAKAKYQGKTLNLDKNYIIGTLEMFKSANRLDPYVEKCQYETILPLPREF